MELADAYPAPDEVPKFQISLPETAFLDSPDCVPSGLKKNINALQVHSNRTRLVHDVGHACYLF